MDRDLNKNTVVISTQGCKPHRKIFKNLVCNISAKAAYTVSEQSPGDPLLRFSTLPSVVTSYYRDWTTLSYCAQSVHEACRDSLFRAASTLSRELLLFSENIHS